MDKGQHLRLVIVSSGTTPVASFVSFSTDLTFHLSAQTDDSTTKDSTDSNGLWNEYDVVGRSGDINFGALVVVNSSSIPNTDNYFQHFISKVSDTAVDWKLVFVSGENNRTVGKTVCYGKGKLTNLSVSAQNRQKATYQGTLNLYGPVTVGSD